MKISDVIVRLGYQQRHAVLLAEISRSLIRFQRALKIVQADKAYRHVVQSYADAFCVLEGQQLLIRAVIACQRFSQASSAMQDVGDVDLQTRQPQILTGPLENLSGSLCGRQRPLVLAQQGKRLDRST